MHQRIMSATVLRAAPAFRQWELLLLAVAVALVCVATPGSSHRRRPPGRA